MGNIFKDKLFGLVVPLIAIGFGFLAGGVIMLLSGNNPIDGYVALMQGVFGEVYYFGETLQRMTPLIFSGLAVAFAFRTGLLNIGVEGQLIVGWFVSVFVGIVIEAPMIIHLPLAILAGALAGALWGFVPGILKAKFQVHEVIVTIMMNYIAMHVVNHFIRNFMLESGQRTAFINDSASLSSDFLTSITDFSRLHWGFLIAVAACFVMWFILWKTKKGFELRSVGYNKHASSYAGMNVNMNIILSMSVSGAFAGIGGAMVGLGTYNYANILPSFTNLGFDGIAVALLGSSTSIGIFLSAFLFGGLKEGANNMQSQAGVAPELVEIIIALIIFFVASSYLIRWIYSRLQSKKEGK
ncbi:branched-chain amino acid ABC transporter permease [Salipaludibacillus keqinensis]|uniref:Branched-chain amino acid ABC transporter permease n=1 Tax=Salipaludibacillus keqinensis TaxID=2045207 RepID=A0A323TGR3_9BACI|nr:ABC transporter permease [Salipaludibacillus keqinensis]PYZ94018.1 branched-chain amino acid ABC transporter permease [Salipaludibacillus keqinensis]